MLSVTYSCITKSSYVTLGINILITIYLGMLMPKKGHLLYFKWFDRPRSAKEPPFFFREVRLGMLMMSILYNIARLAYEITVMDVSVILVASRLVFTILQLIDQWWFCKNWTSFFIEKKMRAYIWFRLFVAVSLWSLIFCLQTTFNTSYEMMGNDAFIWAGGIQTMFWYYWGKHWNFSWGDMNDDRRIPAFVGTLITSAFLYSGLAVFVHETGQQQSSIITAITATMAYFLLGLAFRYLNKITNNNISEKHVDDVPVPSIPTPVPASGNNVAMITDENPHHEIGHIPEENIDTTYPFDSSPVAPTNTSLSTTRTENSFPITRTESIPSLLENGSNNPSNSGVGKPRVKPIHAPIISPFISPAMSRNGSFSHIADDDPHHHINASISDKEEYPTNPLHIKPTTTNPLMTSGSSPTQPNTPTTITPTPLNSVKIVSHKDPLVMDQISRAMRSGRKSSLESFVYYETSHLLSDKIVVVFVQVLLWYTMMVVVERCIESYYEPSGYDDASGQIPPLKWCSPFSLYSGSTLASIQQIIDALF